MPKYRVEIRGENFLMDLGDQVRKRGFLAIRFIEAVDRVEAEQTAIEVVEEQLRGTMLNSPSDLPITTLHHIEVIDSFEGLRPPETNFIWWPESWKEDAK